MSEIIETNQIFEYNGKNPFHIYNVRGNEESDRSLLLNHWHTELEIVFPFIGHSKHYIDGVCHVAEEEKMIIINSGSLHSIIPDESYKDCSEIVTLVLLISKQYLKERIPEIENLYFIMPEGKSRSEICKLMRCISEYASGTDDIENANLYIRGLVDLLLFYMCEDGVQSKDLIMPTNYYKNIERLRGVLSYIQEHYKEPLVQSMIAKNFYFSSEYFSRFFKKSTGFTFVEYVAKYRVQQAKNDIIYTDKNMLEIALDHGFSDSRRLIQAFKKEYGITPLQYRIQERKRLQ